MNRFVFYIIAFLLIGYLFFSQKDFDTPQFAHLEIRHNAGVPIFIKNNIQKISQAPSVHSSTLVALNNQDILAMWFAGSGEGKSDVEIYGSIYSPSSNLWSKPKSYLTRQRLIQDSHQFIKKLGNPVLYRSASGDIHLFVVGVSFGGWATSKIYHYKSSDDAKSFVYMGLLKLGAFMNLSHLVRSQPVGLEDGGFYLPIYHELATKYPLIVRFDKNGEMLYVQKMTSKKGQLQPSIVSLSDRECLAVFRNYYDRAMEMQKCFSGGLRWENPVASNVINEGNSIALFRLNAEVYLIHNTREGNQDESRGTLVLSKLEQNQWKKVAILDIAQGVRSEGKSVEVSYPNVLVSGDFVDIVYTYNRENIAHIRLNQKWITDKE